MSLALAKLALSLPEVRRILAGESSGSRLAALRRESSAAAFLEAFDGLLAEHASRSFGWELLLPTWGEDPDAVLAMVAAHLRDQRPDAARKSSASLRDAARARVTAKLSGSDLAQFEQFITMLEGLVGIREDRAYWQMRLAGSVRLLLLERGRKLVESGRIERPDDIFHLVPAEIEGDGTLSDLVATRRAAWDGWNALTPPAFIGAPRASSSRC